MYPVLLKSIVSGLASAYHNNRNDYNTNKNSNFFHKAKSLSTILYFSFRTQFYILNQLNGKILGMNYLKTSFWFWLFRVFNVLWFLLKIRTIETWDETCFLFKKHEKKRLSGTFLGSCSRFFLRHNLSNFWELQKGL